MLFYGALILLIHDFTDIFLIIARIYLSLKHRYKIIEGVLFSLAVSTWI